VLGMNYSVWSGVQCSFLVLLDIVNSLILGSFAVRGAFFFLET